MPTITTNPAPNSHAAPLRLQVAQLPVAIAAFDRDMNYLAASRAWIDSYGDCQAELIDRNFFDIHPETPREWKDLHQEIVSKGNVLRGEDSWQRRDGTRKWVKWVAQPWRE